jgi:uncharacterized HAD superfamily protein
MSKIEIVKNPAQYGIITKDKRLKITFHNLAVNHEEFCKNIEENSKLIYSQIKHLGERNGDEFIYSKNETDKILFNSGVRDLYKIINEFMEK